MSKSIIAVSTGIPQFVDSGHVQVSVYYKEINHALVGTTTDPILLDSLAIPLTEALLNSAICAQVASDANARFGTSYLAADVLLFGGCTFL